MGGWGPEGEGEVDVGKEGVTCDGDGVSVTCVAFDSDWMRKDEEEEDLRYH